MSSYARSDGQRGDITGTKMSVMRNSRSHSFGARRVAIALGLSLASVSCAEQIVVFDCDASDHGDGSTSSTEDATADGSTPPSDGGTANDGAQSDDAGLSDGGGNDDGGTALCTSAEVYCFGALTADASEVDVRTTVRLTPTVVGTSTQGLTFTVDVADIVTRRAPMRPPLVMSDIQVELAVDADSGSVSFRVNEVPPWFFTTEFVVRLRAQRLPAGPEVSVDAAVTVRGNIVVSGSSTVYAFASDGRPAASVNAAPGSLLYGSTFVDDPEELLVSRDGTLLVFDSGTSPERIRRFSMTGENVHLQDFVFRDSGDEPYVLEGNTGFGMTELPDGRVALVDYEFTRVPKSKIVIWNGDGSYDRTISAADPTVIWRGISAAPDGTLLVAESKASGALVRIDPATGFQDASPLATDITDAYSVLALSDGGAYVGTYGPVIRVSPIGGKTLVNGLPTESWRQLAPRGSTRLLATTTDFTSSGNVAIIENTSFVDWARTSPGGVSLAPEGIASLD